MGALDTKYHNARARADGERQEAERAKVVKILSDALPDRLRVIEVAKAMCMTQTATRCMLNVMASEGVILRVQSRDPRSRGWWYTVVQS